ncbi:MAG: tRNA adenosine(34) deaminase TadA [Pseudanabaena sp. ELA748]
MKNIQTHQLWMDRAISLAKQAGLDGEIPVGAVIVNSEGEAIAIGVNQKERDQDPTAHAEIVAIRDAARVLRDWHLNGCTLYVTLEPCPMCAGAILQARISTLVYGADDPKMGAIRTVANLPDSPLSFHKLEAIAGIREQECQKLLQDWFKNLRQASH